MGRTLPDLARPASDVASNPDRECFWAMKSFFTFHEAFRSLTPRRKAAKVPKGFQDFAALRLCVRLNALTSVLLSGLCGEMERRDHADGFRIYHREHGGTQRRSFGA